MISPADRGAQDGVVHSAAAERDSLLELLSIVTHDLNNPLQSLIVLLELSLDDAPAGSDMRARAEQCLLAADRIKGLTLAMSGLMRGRREDGPRAWARIAALLGRRFERYSIAVEADVDALANTIVPANLVFALTSAGLLALASAAASGLRRHRLRVVGQLRAEGPAVALALGGFDGEGQPVAVAWEPAALGRTQAIVAGDAGLRIEVASGAVSVMTSGGSATP